MENRRVPKEGENVVLIKLLINYSIGQIEIILFFSQIRKRDILKGISLCPVTIYANIRT